MILLYDLSVACFIIIYFCGFDSPLSPKKAFWQIRGRGQPFVYTPNALDDFDLFLEKKFPKIFLKV
jgi:hypothetical protein